MGPYCTDGPRQASRGAAALRACRRAPLAASLPLAFILVTCTGGGTRADSITVTYLANEGFLVTSRHGAVLVDALFGDGLTGYPAVPSAIRRDLESARGIFGSVDCVLATHEHGDHFDAAAVARFLESRAVQFISTPVVVDLLDPLLADFRGPRPIGRYPPRHVSEERACGSARVSLLRLHHGRLPVQNLGFVIAIGGLTVLHVGDTEVEVGDIRPFDLARRGIDLALLPAWHLTESRWLPLVAEIAPRHVVAMHLPRSDAPPSWFGSAGSLGRYREEIRRNFPPAWIPDRPLAARTYGPADGAALLPADNRPGAGSRR